jgi:ribonuclease J
MTLTITVHRGTRQIGGSCIEIAHPNGERLILDAGRPLDAPQDAKDLLPETLDRQAPASVIFSHPHMDHWGLINELPDHWPLWTGSKSAELMQLTAAMLNTSIGPINREISTWTSRTRSFAVGSFTVTPLLTDHSAFDAYMLLIEGAGRRLLYTGDFRIHGRKRTLVERLMAEPPAAVDVLLMEGTNLQSDKPVKSEDDLEQDFVDLARTTPGQIFVDWSAQNIDRTVTLYRAARRTGRDLVVDLYTADVLERAAVGTGVPRPSANFENLKVVITPALKWLYGVNARQDFVSQIVAGGRATSRARVAKKPAIIMARKSLLRDFGRDLAFQAGDAYVFSNWSGYLDEHDPTTGWAMARAAGAKTQHLHTSGHASAKALADFAAAIAPAALVPVHGNKWDEPGIALPPVQRLDDGQPWQVP